MQQACSIKFCFGGYTETYTDIAGRTCHFFARHKDRNLYQQALDETDNVFLLIGSEPGNFLIPAEPG